MSEDLSVSTFHIGDIVPLGGQPDERLLAELSDRLDFYEFEFFESLVFPPDDHEIPTSSWVEIAYCRQLGGAQVLWRSGISGLETTPFFSYGWIDLDDLSDLDEALFRRALLMGAPLTGHGHSNTAYFQN
ncbi:hypothetical protein [Neorhizobium alkalisoli]|uniref:Uncharacterized protein n=1 Tax=Neorhizobium alkalisoli TaxID=528178 RepID=A0A561Q7T3_9HYPH|nr:hypothetical protein [Neorhizobium alkalisoli]TWF46415.1 hypothetical protein FHW37_115112 [Neorhizobium alkalisoli]